MSKLPDSRPETTPEFNQRVQEAMDQDQWKGRDDVGACYPGPGVVSEFDAIDMPHVTYKPRSK